jgi:small subunit ribosomal protein S16
MLSIRFTRIGKKKQPIYRVIVTERTRDPWGKFLEILGTYDPRRKIAELKADRIQYWIGKGAQMTATVNNLMVAQGVVKGDKVRAGKSQPGKKRKAELDKIKADLAAEAEAKEVEAKKAAEAPAEEATPEAPVETPAAEVAAEAPTETPASETPTEPAQ